MHDTSLAAQPWWTEADQAELNVLTWALIQFFQAHDKHCGNPLAYCEQHDRLITATIQVVLEFRYGRILKSKAAWLRHVEHEREAA